MLAALRSLARVAGTEATVLLTGEPGTGKELCARVLHHCSARASGPFVAVDCNASSETMLEREIFGDMPLSDEAAGDPKAGAPRRRRGRVERAAGGTLFLREVAAMSLPLQGRLVHTLEARAFSHAAALPPVPVDVRVVAATRHDLRAAVEAGRFRADLYQRIAIAVVSLPPLRERGDDIRLLAEQCVAQAACSLRGPARALARETLDVLLAHPWPGNVSQLCHAIARAVLLADGPVLLPAHLPAEVRFPAAGFVRTERGDGSCTPRRAAPPLGTAAVSASDPMAGETGAFRPLEELERRHIAQALALTRGQLARAAELLGIHRNTLRRKLQEYSLDGIPPEPADLLAVHRGGPGGLPSDLA